MLFFFLNKHISNSLIDLYLHIHIWRGKNDKQSVLYWDVEKQFSILIFLMYVFFIHLGPIRREERKETLKVCNLMHFDICTYTLVKPLFQARYRTFPLLSISLHHFTILLTLFTVYCHHGLVFFFWIIYK